MITLEDCRAFCDADAALVEEIARREHLALIMAIACGHGRAQETGDPCTWKWVARLDTYGDSRHPTGRHAR